MPTIAGQPVVVAITTFKRPKLLGELLDTVQAFVQKVPQPWVVSVLVVDNDPAETARTVVATRIGVKYVAESKPGIAAVRQRAIDEAGEGSLLAFLDDDVFPEAAWLGELLKTWQSYSPTIVAGYVNYSYPDVTDAWVVGGGFMRRDTRPTGAELQAAAAGNMLVDVTAVRSLGVRFDATLGFSGGEDTLFTRQVVRSGGRIIWCQESVVADFIPLERTTRKFCLNRARSHGSTAVLVDLRLAASPTARMMVRVKALVGGLLRIGWGLIRSAAGKVTSQEGKAGTGARIASRGLGMLGASLGLQSDEYRR
ncbi:glycosyltransferase family 2 protein [Arthrobacter cryoconiti]|uniref:Glycosyltransferase family 2 protein n=1 Tax=Arthrobacter cryoconiti TaxID=748907 RepID=A0ABV8R4B5_9MICC|nr:glycosyltransferase [Arthrobacter cryoconiti]MCC9067022.1 glycosyltransferase [Arthrobacter cryoconiti]